MFPIKKYQWLILIAFFALTLGGCGGGDEAKAPGSSTQAAGGSAPSESGAVWIERWALDTPMTLKRAGLVAVASEGRIYAIGGGEYSEEGLLIFDSVEYTEVLEGGRLGPWKEASKLTRPRVYPTAVTYGGYIYVMGGESSDTLYKGKDVQRAPELLSSIERAAINADGSLGAWTLEASEMNFPRRGGELYVHNGWLYAAGGFSGDFLNDVEKAKINSDGSIGEWSEANYSNRDRYISGYASHGDHLYLIGGHVNSSARAMESVEVAKANPDGTLTDWEETSPLYTKTFLNTAVVHGDTLFSMAGHNTVNLTSTQRATILPDGKLSAWEPDTPLNIPRRAPSAVVVGDLVYLLGGMVKPLGNSKSVDVVEVARILPGKKLGNWVEPGSEGHKLYKEWKAGVPVEAQNHLIRARLYLKLKEYDTVLFDVAEVLKVLPGHFEAYNVKGETLLMIGDHKGAIEALNKSIEGQENLEARLQLGYVYFANGNYAKAVENYGKAAQAKPDSPLIRYNLGAAYMNAGDYASARKEFEWVVDKAPEMEDAAVLLSITRGAEEK